MYDSVSWRAIPGDSELVAGYIDGLYAWPPEAWASFAGRVLVRIAVHASTNAGEVLDVESGDATPSQAPGWAQMRRAAGQDPSVYCSEAVWDQCRQAFASAGVTEPHWWVAAYPGGGPVIPPGAVAHQWQSTNDWDRSVVADYWAGVDGPAPPPPAPPDDYLELLL